MYLKIEAIVYIELDIATYPRIDWRTWTFENAKNGNKKTFQKMHKNSLLQLIKCVQKNYIRLFCFANQHGNRGRNLNLLRLRQQ